MVYLYSIISVLLISSLSFVGLVSLLVKPARLHSVSNLLVSLAVGGLLGDTFIHLLPQSFVNYPQGQTTPVLVLLGLMLFFLLEKYIYWRHCHNSDCHQPNHAHPVVALSLIGDTIHNFIDGMVVAASYLVSLPLGLTTSLAIILHEIPQELGDFGILIHHRYTPIQAIFLNLATALSAIIGVITILFLPGIGHQLSPALIPIAAGGFLYIALSDLIPQLHHHTHPRAHGQDTSTGSRG